MSDSASPQQDSQYFKQQGNVAFIDNDFKSAIELFTKAIELEENHIYYSNRCAAYLNDESLDKALADAEKCIELAPEWGKGYGRRGEVLFSMGKYPESLESYQKAKELQPEIRGLSNSIKKVKEKIDNREKNDSKNDSKNEENRGMNEDFFKKMMENDKLNNLMQDQNFVNKINDIHEKPDNLESMIKDPQMMELCESLMGSTFGDSFKNLMNLDKNFNMSEQIEKLKKLNEQNETNSSGSHDSDDSSDYSVDSEDIDDSVRDGGNNENVSTENVST